MTLARQVVAGRTYLISRRCTQRQFLLRPDPMTEQIYLYCLGEAAQRYEITLHGFIAMSNHQHLLVRDNHANFPAFLAHLHKMLSKAMNALRRRWENFWATEQPNAVYLVEPADRFAKLVYLLANPFADHLVDRISDWPGACSLGMQPVGDDEISEAAEGVLSVQRQDAQRSHAPYRAARRLRGAVGGGVGGEAPRGPEPRGRARTRRAKSRRSWCARTQGRPPR